MIPTAAAIPVIVALAIIVWLIFYYAGMPLDAGSTAVVTIVIALLVVAVRALFNRRAKKTTPPRKTK